MSDRQIEARDELTTQCDLHYIFTLDWQSGRVVLEDDLAPYPMAGKIKRSSIF